MIKFFESEFVRDIKIPPRELMGWEKTYDELNVKVLKIARELGHCLPRIDVVETGGIYQLVFGRAENFENYGGHTRAIVAFQRNEDLGCRLFTGHRQEIPPDTCYDYIFNMTSQRKISNDALFRLKENLQFLPLETRIRFIRENKLVVLEDGRLLDKDNYDNPPPF